MNRVVLVVSTYIVLVKVSMFVVGWWSCSGLGGSGWSWLVSIVVSIIVFKVRHCYYIVFVAYRLAVVLAVKVRLVLWLRLSSM